MNCRTFAKRLYDYQDGTLTDTEKAEFELHQSGCERCAALVQAESETRQVVSGAVQQTCEGLDPSSVRFTGAAPRQAARFSLLAAWRVPAAIAALLVLVLLAPALVRRLLPEERDVAGARDSWTEEIQVTYETGLHAETTLVSHDSGVTTIIEIQVSYLTR